MENQEENTDTNKNPGLALGIDFGNSKISGAVWNSKKKEPSIVEFDEKYQFPSTLYYNNLSQDRNNIDKTNFSVGVDFQIDMNKDYFIYDIKKLLGQKKDEENQEIIENLKYKTGTDQEDNIFYKIEDNFIRLDDLANILIEKIKFKAEEQFKDVVNSCTISVPHGFNNNQRNAIKEAAYKAGIKNVYIINEPLSTAIYYAFKNKIQKNEKILIIDFGSSKLDVTLLTINPKNSIKVKTSGGDNYLGGDIFNKDLINEIKNSYKYEGGGQINEPEKLLLLEILVEKAKKELTFREESEIKIEKFDGEKDLKYLLKRKNFNDLNNETFNKIYNIINKVIKESGKRLKEIDHVILQGDAIRITGLTNLLKEKFEDIDIITNLYDSIAYGNAIYTAKKINIMNNKQFDNFKIHDISPISVGLRTEGDLMSIMLPRGSQVPIKAFKRFVTTQDNQNNIKFEIYEGERKLIKDNRKLDCIILSNIPQMNKKQVKVEVTFEIDEEFNLTVTCKELSTNIEKSCKIIMNEDLSQRQISQMIENSNKCNEEDNKEKERIKALLKLNDKIFEYCHLNEGNEDILRELEGYRNWIKHSSHSPKEEFENKLKELNDRMSNEKNKKIKNRQETAN